MRSDTFTIPRGTITVGRSRTEREGADSYAGILVSTAASERQAILSWKPEDRILLVKDAPGRVNGSRLQPGGRGAEWLIDISRFTRLRHGDAIGFPLEWFLVDISQEGQESRARLMPDTDRDTVRVLVAPSSYVFDRLRVDLATGMASIAGQRLPLLLQARTILRVLCLNAGQPVDRLHPDLEIGLGYQIPRDALQKRLSEIRTALARFSRGRRGDATYAEIVMTHRSRKGGSLETSYTIVVPPRLGL